MARGRKSYTNVFLVLCLIILACLAILAWLFTEQNGGVVKTTTGSIQQQTTTMASQKNDETVVTTVQTTQEVTTTVTTTQVAVDEDDVTTRKVKSGVKRFDDLGNSGLEFASLDDADAYGQATLQDSKRLASLQKQGYSGYRVLPVYWSDGEITYTINWE